MKLTVLRPRTRGDCEDGPRPCPWTECRYHLENPEETCALDVADSGAHTIEEIGQLMGLKVGRVLEIERMALASVAVKYGVLELPRPIVPKSGQMTATERSERASRAAQARWERAKRSG